MKKRLKWARAFSFVLIGCGTSFAIAQEFRSTPSLPKRSLPIKAKPATDRKPILRTTTGFLESMQSGISTTNLDANVTYSVTTRTGKTITFEICKALPKDIRERLDLTSNSAIGNWVRVTWRQNRNGTRCLLDLRLS